MTFTQQNRIARPAQVTGLFMAELRYSRLLGGDVEILGPMEGHELRRIIKARRAPYPGNHQPSVRMWEVPR